jgi:hypothetical protein
MEKENKQTNKHISYYIFTLPDNLSDAKETYFIVNTD